MRQLYLDSSILVSLATNDTKRATAVLKRIKEFDSVASSELAVVECQSGISSGLSAQPRLLVSAEQNLNQILARMTLYSIHSLVLGSARSLVKRYRMTTGLRSLDAIHVATAILIRDALGPDQGYIEYLTADHRQHETLTAEGFLGELIS